MADFDENLSDDSQLVQALQYAEGSVDLTTVDESMDTDNDIVADEKSIEDRGRSSEKRKDSKKRKRSASPVSTKRSKLTKVETPKSGQDKYCLVMQYDDNITFDEFLRTGHYAILKQFLNSPDVDDYILVDHAKNVRQSPNKMHAWNGHNHVHVGISTSKKYSLHKSYSVTKFKDAVKSLFPQTNKYIPHLEKMRVPDAWVRYVTTRPRKLRNINGCWADILYDINDDKETTNVDSVNTRPYKKSKCAQNLDFLVNIIRKYHCKHSGDITKLLHTNIDESERDGIYQILASSDWNTTVKKALMIDQQRTESMTFNELLTEFAETKPTTEGCLTVENSKILLENILDRQNIDYKKFTENLYDVLNMTKPKKNLFVLEGVPNAGKSYIARSLLPVARYYAEVRPQPNNNFIYNDATGKNMLLIEEPSFSDPNHLEQFKLIAEGHPTFVNRKNQDAQILNRTPVIVTTNKPVWSWHPSAKKAFIARGYYYKFNLTSDMLKMVHLRLHPLMWKSIFDKITETRLKETETITEKLHYNYRQHDDHSGDAEETQSVFTRFSLSPIEKDGGQDRRIGESREHDKIMMYLDQQEVDLLDDSYIHPLQVHRYFRSSMKKIMKTEMTDLIREMETKKNMIESIQDGMEAIQLKNWLNKHNTEEDFKRECPVLPDNVSHTYIDRVLHLKKNGRKFVRYWNGNIVSLNSHQIFLKKKLAETLAEQEMF